MKRSKVKQVRAEQVEPVRFETVQEFMAPRYVAETVREFSSCYLAESRAICIVWLDDKGDIRYLDAGWLDTLQLAGAVVAVQQDVVAEDDTE